MSKKILLGTIILFAALSAWANDSLNVRTVGSWPFYRCLSVTLDTTTAQKLAIMGVGGGLFIADITDPLHPNKIGEVKLKDLYIRVIKLRDNYAYCLSDTTGLLIVDYTDPYSPVLVGHCQYLGRNRDLAISGNYAYVAADFYGLKIIDISNPSNPVEKNCFVCTDGVQDVLIKDTLAYFSTFSGDSGLKVLNIADPENPVPVGYGDVPTGYLGLSDTFLYGGNGSIYTYNISDPANPINIGSGGTVYFGFSIYDTLAFGGGTGFYGGFYINSLSDPLNPVTISQCSTYYFRDIAAYGGYAYVADDREGLKVVDISDPVHPTVVARCPTAYIEDNGLLYQNNYIYLPAMDGGLRMIDVSDPSSPIETGCSFYADKENEAVDVIVRDTIAYVSDRLNGLRVLNIADKANPAEICSLSFKGYTYAMADKDTLLFIALWPEFFSGDSSSIRVINIADPRSPAEIGHICTSRDAMDISTKGNYLFASLYDNALVTIDISDPTNPALIYSIDTLGLGWNQYLQDTILYLANDSKGLSIINVADPLNPVKISSVPPFSHTTGVFVDSGFAYMVDDTLGLKVINITDPSNPIVTGYYLFNYDDPYIYLLCSTYRDVTASGKNIFITHPFNILQALEYYGPDAGISFNDYDKEMNKPQTFLLKDAYPNPARNKFTIGYQLPAKAEVRLNLYNVTGQLVRSMDMGTQQPGYYNIPFKTDKLSSGVYFYKLTAGNDSQTRKLVILK